MANTLGDIMTLLAAGATPDPGRVAGTLRVFNEQVTLASQPISDTIEVAKLPRGAVPLFGIVTSSVSLGTSTVAIGISGTVAKYRAAATLAATAGEVFGEGGGVGGTLVAEETVIATVGVAALPASGTLRVMFVYALD